MRPFSAHSPFLAFHSFACASCGPFVVSTLAAEHCIPEPRLLYVLRLACALAQWFQTIRYLILQCILVFFCLSVILWPRPSTKA